MVSIIINGTYKGKERKSSAMYVQYVPQFPSFLVFPKRESSPLASSTRQSRSRYRSGKTQKNKKYKNINKGKQSCEKRMNKGRIRKEKKEEKEAGSIILKVSCKQ